MPPAIAIQNQSTVLTDAQVQAAIPALQKQVDGDFAPVYLSACELRFAAKSEIVAGKVPSLIVLDHSDQAGALGYHSLQTNCPIGFVFAKDDLASGLSWTVTLSHELLELLADPYVDQVVLVEQSQGVFGSRGILLAHEVADACEADQFAYEIDGVKVSDFVAPEWFNGNSRSDGRYSFKGHCTAPQQILTGGYIGVRSVRGLGQWGQVTGQRAPDADNSSSPAGQCTGPQWTVLQHVDGKLVPIVPPKGSRRERRSRPPLVTAAAHPLFASQVPAALFGPVRSDIDAAVNEGRAVLHSLAGQASAVLSNLSATVKKLATLSAGQKLAVDGSMGIPGLPQFQVDLEFSLKDKTA